MALDVLAPDNLFPSLPGGTPREKGCVPAAMGNANLMAVGYSRKGLFVLK